MSELDGASALHTEYDVWRASWSVWSARELVDQPVRSLYATLFSAHSALTARPEELECILGTGLLSWAPTREEQVKRHVLTSAASILLDANSGALSVVLEQSAEVVSLELDMLDPARVPARIADLRDDTHRYDSHPLHREAAGSLVRRLVHTLGSDGEYNPADVVPSPTATPRAAFAPAIILRRRSSLGLVKIFDDIAADIAASGRVPDGLLPLIDPDHEPDTSSDPSDGAVVELDGADDVFLPLPLNSDQLRIIRRVDMHAQTVVQGPPGTGKTHTAAALLTHLLAQGKRVLVTAQTDRALKEVREKLPDAIKPLAVAVVGKERSDMADLKVAVERISSMSSDADDARSSVECARSLEAIDRLRRRRAELHRALLQARGAEVAVHEQRGYDGTLAAVARQYHAERGDYEWITQFCAPTDEPSPLSDHEAGRWLSLLRDDELNNDSAEATNRLVDLSDVPNPTEFATLVEAEASQAAGAATHSSLVEHNAFVAIAQLTADRRSDLRARMHGLARTAGELEQRQQSWMTSALHDVRNGRAATWIARADHVARLLEDVQPALRAVGRATEVSVTDSADLGTLRNLARNLQVHIAENGPLKTQPDGSPRIGAFTNKTVKAAKPLFDAVRVNREIPVRADALLVFLAHLDAERQLDALDRAWPTDTLIPPEDTLHERVQWHVTELEQLRRLLALADQLMEEERHLAQAGIPRPDWNDLTSILTYSALVDAATAHDAAAEASRPLNALAARIESTSRWADAAPVVRDLHAAIVGRDRDGFARSHARLTRLHEARSLLAERAALTSAVATQAPALCREVVDNPSDQRWPVMVPTLERAWKWARTGAWILEQDSTDTNVVQAKIGVIESDLRREVGTLAATRAWKHAVSPERLTGQSRADLTQYAQLVKAYGKGTGKYALAKRAEIRAAMDRCRPSVPVWILPIYRIAEQLPISQNMFDVVVVDEASQAGLEATFLQYLAPKIVVIGDDKQVSPLAVGVDRQQLRDLGDRYLYDDRYKASWQDPARSLFDEATMRFGSKQILVEHRRCVPEIIGFSNRIAYEPENIRLVPVRQYGADRLDPVKVHHVKDGYERGSAGSRVNPPEVDAVVAHVLECASDPRYDGKTFGVISLSGTQQARQIEAKLLESLPAKEWAVRDLRCGDATAFQGSERDVMFLSMVSAVEPGRRLAPATMELYVQRFNVAFSRAKDQVWLVHSITLEDVPNSEDMRHHLLEYCYGIVSNPGDPSTMGRGVVPDDERVDPFDSLFEQRVYNRIVDRGFTVVPQVVEMDYKLDLVIIGPRGRLAVECDGDAWHGPDRYEADLARQRELERCGWRFFRIRESAWYVDQAAVLDQLWTTLDSLGITVSTGGVSQPVTRATSVDPASAAETSAEAAPTALEASEGLSLTDDPGPALFTTLPAARVENGEDDPVVLPPPASAQPTVVPGADRDDEEPPPRLVRSAVPLRKPKPPRLPEPPPSPQLWCAEDRAGQVSIVQFKAVDRTVVGTQRSLDQLHTRTHSQIVADQLRHIIVAEGPVEGKRLTRLLGARFGVTTMYESRRAEVLRCVPATLRRTKDGAGTFYWPQGVDPAAYRVVRQGLGDDRTLNEISPQELMNALCLILRHGPLTERNAVEATAKLFALDATSEPVFDRLTDVVELSLSVGAVRTDSKQIGFQPSESRR